MIKIEPDKWKHFFVGMLIGAILQIITAYLMPQHYVISIVTTFISMIAISYGFELFSLITKKGHYEILDAVAGTIGGIAGMSLILVIGYLHKYIL